MDAATANSLLKGHLPFPAIGGTTALRRIFELPIPFRLLHELALRNIRGVLVLVSTTIPVSRWPEVFGEDLRAVLQTRPAAPRPVQIREASAPAEETALT